MMGSSSPDWLVVRHACGENPGTLHLYASWQTRSHGLQAGTMGLRGWTPLGHTARLTTMHGRSRRLKMTSVRRLPEETGLTLETIQKTSSGKLWLTS